MSNFDRFYTNYLKAFRENRFEFKNKLALIGEREKDG